MPCLTARFSASHKRLLRYYLVIDRERCAEDCDAKMRQVSGLFVETSSSYS